MIQVLTATAVGYVNIAFNCNQKVEVTHNSQVNTMDSLSNLELIYSSGTISLHDRLEKLWLYMPSS